MDDLFGQPLSPSYGAGFDNLLDFPELGAADPGAAAPKGAKAESQPTAVQQAQAEEVQRTRNRELQEKASLEAYLSSLGAEEGQYQPQVSNASMPALEHKAGSSKDGDSSEKTAARNKASRERARRERLNDSFTELSKALDPSKAVKSDKTNIIADAIRVVTQLRAENGQLRQLNKFLEERVGNVEKQKAELQLQQAFLQQGGEAEATAAAASAPVVSEGPTVFTGVPLASVTHQGQAITYIAVPTGPSQINPQMQHALMKHAMASGLPGLQEQHGHVMKFEGGLEREGQAAAHAAGHAAANLAAAGAAAHRSSDSPSVPPASASLLEPPSKAARRHHSSTPHQLHSEQERANSMGMSLPEGSLGPGLDGIMPFSMDPAALGSGPWGMFSSEPMHPQMRMTSGMMPRPPMIGPGSWMSQAALDTSQDGLKRPPAA
eukprot:jgi/Astpho2/9225/Aster-07182